MAILKSVVDVNNGNTGWDKSDVLDALETVFANLGWNNGTAASGVPCVIKAPGWGGGNSSSDLNRYRNTTTQWYNESNFAIDNFRHCGGDVAPNGGSRTRYFIVSNNGTSAYRMVEEFRINGSTSVEFNNPDQIAWTRHGLSTGDAIHYAAGVSSPDANKVIGGLSVDTIYYAIKIDDTNFSVAANATDAANGTAINITAATTTGYYFRRQDTSALDNITITCKLGDTLNFITSGASGAGGTFNLVYNSDSYDANKLLTKYDSNWQVAPSGNASDGSVDTVWNTQAYRQSENEVLDPLRSPAGGTGTNTGDGGIIKYIYANSTNASMKGEIVVEPWVFANGSNYNPYWKYTVPASGGRSELKLRVYRGNRWYDQAYIVAITINSIGSGWTNDAVFTIPGEEIGGVATTNDVTFGVNADETSNNAYDGTPSIGVVDLKTGSNFYQKHPSGFYAVARVEHDSAKTFGTTFYGFGMDPANDYQLTITSGSDWDYLNYPGIHYNVGTDDNIAFGRYNGLSGLDLQGSYSYVRREEGNDEYWRTMNYATTSTPTAYPLQIRVYRAQSPQDTDFAIIQFTQTINGVVQPYGTFTIAKGSQHGAGIYDLDYVFQDAVMMVTTATRSVQFKYGNTQYNYYAGIDEPADSNTKTRAASYGYMRDGYAENDYGTQTTSFTCNIDTDNGENQFGSVMKTYYRNSTYDSYSYTSSSVNYTNEISPSADYYKPIKGLPITNACLPIPYYLPDDFVMLQVATTPGLVSFRTGDTVTISGSEIYEIIVASYESQQNGLDNVNNNSTIGMLFMARTT